ncbi:hypothetical protein GYB61_05855 [bacterium]|nr:hypothetical protein [bacterium]
MPVDQLVQLAKRLGIRLRADPIQDPVDGDRYFFPIDARPASESSPSVRKSWKAIRNLAEELGLDVEPLLFDPVVSNLEEGLRASLLIQYSQHLRNSFVAPEYGGVRVWLEAKSRSAIDQHGDQIKSTVTAYFDNAGLKVKSATWLREELTPSSTALLSAIRLLAPVNAESLGTHLEGNAFTVPSADWLNRQLDRLRRSGQTVLLPGKHYALTASSLEALGTKKSRNSPDILRLLALSSRTK